MRRRKHSGGFTLAEAVISITILGMIGGLVFGTFGRAIDGRQRAEKISSRYHQIRQAMLRMSRELQMAYISEHRDCEDPRTDTVFKTENASNGMRLDFTSFSHYKLAADANESDQNELSYFVGRHPDPDEDQDPNELVLIRREDERIDEEPDEGGIEEVMCEGVTDLEFEFYNPKEDRWEDEWDTLDQEYAGRLPMFISIKMKAYGPRLSDTRDPPIEEFITKTRVFLRRSLYMGGRKCQRR